MTDKPFWMQLRDAKLKGAKIERSGKQSNPAKEDSDNSGNSGKEKPEEKEAPAKQPPKSYPAKRKIKPRSKKQAKTMRDLKVAYGPYLLNNPVCLIQSPICTERATAVHHIKGRGVNEVLNQKTWMPCCAACNGYVEQHDAWARENGFKISKHSK